jgi:glucosamine--fructose-6-phosphate aminotransferase (isomerizing)
MSNATHKLGFYTEAEIHSQPRCWAHSLRDLQQTREIERIVREFSGQRRWLFIGCGSSYYLALAAAASWKTLTGLPAQAFPASELLLFPNLVLDKNSPVQPVLISRSGTTSEVLRAGEYLNAQGMSFVAVTCTNGEALQKMATATLSPSAADEKSTVMTLSFTSMLLTLQCLAAKFAGNTEFLDSLLHMPEGFQDVLEEASPAVKSFVNSHEFADYVWLGQGPFYGLACEGALKVEEMSCSYAQSFHTLEFRHGPKSIVAPQTLIMFQMSETGFEAEREVLEEIKDLGGTTLVVANEADMRTRRAADLLVELRLKGHECAGLAAHIVPAQLMGLYTGLKKGLDPDNPHNLTRVVILP